MADSVSGEDSLLAVLGAFIVPCLVGKERERVLWSSFRRAALIIS